MSALTCPVCSGAMRETTREQVTIDTCTQCRGVWLDRGELDKLLGEMRSDDNHREQPRYRDDDDDDRHEYRGDQNHGHGYPRKKRSKMESFMDIFD